jgi:hypothetical protein
MNFDNFGSPHTPLQNLIGSAVGQRTTGILEPNPMNINQALMSGKKRRIDATHTGGASLGSYSNDVTTSILDSFQSSLISKRGGESFLDNTEVTHNTPHPINRHAKPPLRGFDPCGKYEPCLLWTRELTNTSFEDNILHRVHDNVMPLDIHNIASMNYFLFSEQIALSKGGRKQEYLKRDAESFMRHIRFDGIPDTESMSDGSESYSTSGFYGNSVMVPSYYNQHAGGYKRLTMITKGAMDCLNVWGSDISPGGELHLLMKKFPLTKDTVFRLSSKRNLAGFLGSATKDKSGTLTAVNESDIRPYLLTAICLPFGGTLTLEHKHYLDELGRDRYDAASMYIGTVARIPPDHIYKEMSRDTTSMKPYTDAFDASDAHNNTVMLMNIIIDSDDGATPLL